MSRRPWLTALTLLAGGTTVLLAAGGAGLWLALQPLPAAIPLADLQAGDVSAARRLINRKALRATVDGQPLSLALTGPQLNALAHDMSARLFQGRARIILGPQQAQAVLSLPVQTTPLRALARWGAWFNVYATVSSSPTSAPTLSSVRIGRLPIPPALALWTGRRIAQHYGLLEVVEMGLSSVLQVRIAPDQAQATVRWREDLSTRAFGLVAPPDMAEALQVYHHALARLLTQPALARRGTQAIPLTAVMRPLFELAHQRSLAQALAASAADSTAHAARENRAVLLVLALYVNQVSLSHVLPAAHAWPALPPRTLTLQGREDFAQHYLTSAMMATDLGGRLTDIVGTYKELLDATPQGGGSGFSFNDLAADKAGMRLGRRAVQAPLELQARVSAGQDDGFFMPDVADLPEFLSETELRRRYGGVGAAPYQQVVEDIDQRVERLAVLH